MSIYKVGNQNIDGLIPDTRGERAFPSNELGYHTLEPNNRPEQEAKQRANDFSGTDPFIMLDHIGPSKMPVNWHLSGDHGIHPHRGFETITFMFKGNLHHLDTVFTARPLLTNGSVQQMNAGKGIRHGGDFWADEHSGEFHEVQLWVNSPAHEKMSEPYVRNYNADHIPHIGLDNLQLRLIAGTYQDHTGPVQTFANIRVLHGTLTSDNDQANSRISLDLKQSSQFLFVMIGEMKINDILVGSGETLILKDLNEICLSGQTHSQFLLLSGTPWQQPIATGGPFVMNTKTQIQQAFADAKRGVF